MDGLKPQGEEFKVIYSKWQMVMLVKQKKTAISIDNTLLVVFAGWTAEVAFSCENTEVFSSDIF